MSSFVQVLNHHRDETGKLNKSDNDVDSWFLMGSSIPVSAITVSYLLFVLKIGPKMMENRKAFKLKYILLFYNLSIALLNAYMFKEILDVVLQYPIRNYCMPLPDNTPLTNKWHRTVWTLFLSKNIELLDTIFFVLRKKQSQVTFLHVYHHAILVLSMWGYLKYIKSAQGIVSSFINCFVHIIMYMYYFLAALGPKIQKYLWWKRYITVIQLGQFAIILTYLLTTLAVGCEVHKGLSLYMAMNGFIFSVMFYNFYRKAYSNTETSASHVRIKTH